MDGHDDDAVVSLDVLVDDQHPPPRPEEEPHCRPPAAQLGAKLGELLESAQQASDTSACVRRKAQRDDETVEILGGGSRQLDASHALELIQLDRLAPTRLLSPQRCALVGTIDPIEQQHDIGWIWIGVIDCARQQRSGERALIDVDTTRQPRQLRRVLVIERDVQPSRCHTGMLHAATRRVHH